jgi:hypothetical protein
MLHHLLHPLKLAWGERIALFWPIWAAITAIGVMLVIRVVPARSNTPLEQTEHQRHCWSRADTIAAVFLCLFLGCYVAGSLVWEDFTYYDNSHFTNGTLVGHDIPRQISPEAGRFWPLGHQEFNLLRHFTHSITGYHALRIFQVLFMCAILLFLDGELSVRARVGLILLLLITPSILISFSGLIYPEANVMFWLVCLMWSVKSFEQSRSIAWAMAAMIASQFLLYYKETAFLLLFGFAAGRLLLRCWRINDAGWDFKRLQDPESRLDLCLAFMVVPYFLYYLAAMFPTFGMGYNKESRLPLFQVIVSYLKLDVVVWILVAATAVRIVLILRRRVLPSPFWDGLALAGIGCFASYVILHMVSSYYLAPVDLIAVLYLGRLAFLSIGTTHVAFRLCALALLSLVCLQDCSLSWFRMYERKNVIHAKAEIGHVIEGRYKSDPQSVRRLFFPFANSFHIMEFASYLSYIGVPVEELPAGSRTGIGVFLAGKTIQKDGPCGYRAFVCHPGQTPGSGDLVVVLPDDLTSIDESNRYRLGGSALLFSYDPRPPIPQCARPFVNHLHVVSPVFSNQRLPDSWLKASVSIWN